MNFTDPCRARLQRRETAIGTFVFSSDVASTEVVARAGFDYAVIDLEHAPLTIADVLAHARAADSAGVSCWARVGHAEPPEIGRILDTGVQGLIMSHFGRDVALSRAMLDGFRYPPHGSRGTCSGVRGLRYLSEDLNGEIVRANERAFAIGLIEDAQVLDRLDEVLALPGLDAVMAGGAGDLSASMGLHGQGNHPKVREAAERIVRAARERGLKAGVYIGDTAGAQYWRDVGVDFIAYSIDYKVFAQAYAAAHATLAAVMRG
ncbi:MAG: aldolase/citrate lyase family protein [Burkholderiaceae bacterium]|nr:aldolase/citrate lyase family protein [Burkholderiaceae bacterium]